MNRLSTEKRAQSSAASSRATASARPSGSPARRRTRSRSCWSISGAACAEYQDATLRDLPCKTIECDEIWAFCYAKAEERSRAASGARSATATCGPGRRSAPTRSSSRPGWSVSAPPMTATFMHDLAQPARGAACRSPPTGFAPTGSGRSTPSGQVSTTRSSTRSTARPRRSGTALQPAGPSRTSATSRSSRATRTRRDLDQLRRASEPHDADGHAPVHAADQRVLEEGREPRARRVAALHALQLRPPSQDLTQGKTYPTTPAMAAGVADHVWTLTEIAELLESDSADHPTQPTSKRSGSGRARMRQNYRN